MLQSRDHYSLSQMAGFRFISDVLELLETCSQRDAETKKKTGELHDVAHFGPTSTAQKTNKPLFTANLYVNVFFYTL